MTLQIPLTAYYFDAMQICFIPYFKSELLSVRQAKFC